MKAQKILPIVFVLFLSGCNFANQRNPELPVQPSAACPQHISAVIGDHLIVEADVEAAGKDSYQIYKGHRKFLLPEQLIEAFQVDEEISRIVHNQEDIYEVLTDQRSLVSAGRMYYSVKAYRSGYGAALQGTKTYYTMEEEFDSGIAVTEASPEWEEYLEAADEVRGIAGRLGLELADSPRIRHYLDGNEIRARMEDNFGIEGVGINPAMRLKTDWSLEDDCIYMVWDVCLDGIPMLSGNYSGENMLWYDSMAPGVSLVACYHDGVLQGMDITAFYEMDAAADEVSSLISLEEAMESVKYCFRNIDLDSDILFSKVQLAYVPCLTDSEKQTYRFVPAWVFFGRQQIREDDWVSDRAYLIKINAVNGEWIH